MTYPHKDKFEYSLSKRMYDYYSKDYPPDQEIDKEHPAYKYLNPNIVNYRIMASIIKNPLGDPWDTWVNFQGYGLCGDIETKTLNCLEAYGLPQSMRKCVDLLEDYHECMSGSKSFYRVKLMREERHRQYENGERKFKYAVPPKIGVYQW